MRRRTFLKGAAAVAIVASGPFVGRLPRARAGLPTVSAGVWTPIASTALSASAIYGNLVPGGFNPTALTKAWNGGCWNQRDRKLALVCNSGHGDGPSNGVVTFSANTLEWTNEILWPGGTAYSPDYPSPAPPNGIDPYPDGTPCGRHTYAHTQWIGNKYMTTWGSLYSGSGGSGGLPWTADPAYFPNPFTSWVARTDAPNYIKQLGAVSGFDEAKRLYYSFSMGGLWSFDDGANAWTQRGAGGIGPGEDPASNGAIDPVGRMLWWLGPYAWTGSGHAGAAAAFLDGSAGTAPLDITLVSADGSGDVSIQNAQGPGFVYDRIRRIFVAWGSYAYPNRLYLIDPATLRYNGSLSRWEVDCRVEDPLGGTTGPGITTLHGLYGRMGHDLQDDVLVVMEDNAKDVFLYRVQYRQTRAFAIPAKTWVAQPLVGNFGQKLVAGGQMKHTHALSDEAHEQVVLIGGDTTNCQDSDPQMDAYDVRTNTWTILTPRCGTSPSLYQPDRVDNIIFVHDTTTPQYIGFQGFYGSTQAGEDLAQICGTNHGIAIGPGSTMLYSRGSGLWNPASWAAPPWGYGSDVTATGQGCYDPVTGRVYSIFGTTIQWLDIATGTWGRQDVSASVLGTACYREWLCIDVAGRKVYWVNPRHNNVAGDARLAYMSINTVDGSFGTAGYVPTATIPHWIAYGTDMNIGMDFDNLNRVLGLALIVDFAGAVHHFETYAVDTDTWEDWPVTSPDFPGGEAQGAFVCGNAIVYDRAHNAFVIFGGNGNGYFAGTTDLVPRPTKLALWRYAGGPSTLVAAVLPNARAVQVGTPVTVSATVINTSSEPATQVGIALGSMVPSSFGYWRLDTTMSPPQLVGAPNTPVDIPGYAPPAPYPHKDFLIFMTPTGAFGPTELVFTFAGINTPTVPTLVGINTLLLLASATPTPDMLALAATSPNDGIVRIPGVTGTGVFSVATINLGVADTITVSADTGAVGMPVDVQICQTDPATGACLASPSPTVTTVVAAGAEPTFGFFVRALGTAIALDPANNRVFARFRRSDSLIVGGTSVAVTTQ